MQAMMSALLEGNHVLKPRSWTWDFLLIALMLVFSAALSHPALQKRMVVQVMAIPLLMLWGLLLATVLLGQKQAAGILFAVVCGVLAYLFAQLMRQIELYRENQRLEYEKHAAQEAERLKSQFLSHITHELRTPLTAIMGFNNMNLMGEDIAVAQRTRNSEIVDRNCRNMLALVNNLLDQAKLEAGQMSVSRNPDDLREVVNDAVTTVTPLAAKKPIEIKVSYDHVPQYLDIDAFRLGQILLNLLSNAIKFTGKGEIRVAAAWRDGTLTLEVADTGPGMPEEVVRHLFQSFQQADANIAATHGGTGLGLVISCNLAQLMGGDITVRSALGAGTTFTVTTLAPHAQAPMPAVAESEGISATQQRAGTVLVVDDTEDLRMLIVHHLKRFGVTALVAENGAQAVEIALAKRPDAILMDMEMPVMGGVDAARELRAKGFTAPIIALTAHKGEAEQQRALAAGCNAVLEKPMSRANLQGALEWALAPKTAKVH